MARKKTPEELRKQAKELKERAREVEAKEDARYGARLRQIADEMNVTVDECLAKIQGEQKA
jgi:hypothetical protein